MQERNKMRKHKNYAPSMSRIILVIPFFFFLIGIEEKYIKRRKDTREGRDTREREETREG